MPALLKKDAIRLLEASANTLRLVATGLGTPNVESMRQKSSICAPEIGLVGVAAELGMAACLVHAFGHSAIEKSSGKFKPFREILHDFRQMIREQKPVADFLTSGVKDDENHRTSLLNNVGGFGVLATARAGGLHAGKGVSRDVAIFQCNSVSDFLDSLRTSNKIRPYLKYVPRVQGQLPDRTLIIENLTSIIRNKSDDEFQAALASVFLVLPDLPENEPDWIEAFDRVAISPKPHDVNFLLDILESALPASLRRSSSIGGSLPVVVRPDDPDAIPIAPYHLSRSLTILKDQWASDAATANGRLKSGIVDLPPRQTVVDAFGIGLSQAGVLSQEGFLTAHESWSFIAASISSQGTTGPYWFLVRSTNDLGQLLSILEEAYLVGTAYLKKNYVELEEGTSAIRSDKAVSKKTGAFEPIVSEITIALERKSEFQTKITRSTGTNREISVEFQKEILSMADSGGPIGPLLRRITEINPGYEAVKYWTQELIRTAVHAEDITELIKVQFDENFGSINSTGIRKALRRIDFNVYGPKTV